MHTTKSRFLAIDDHHQFGLPDRDKLEMEQRDVLTSGVQLWSKSVLACRSDANWGTSGLSCLEMKGRRFAFCSSLAVLIYDVEAAAVTTMLAGFETYLTGIAWSWFNARFIVTGCEDGRLVLWDSVSEDRIAVCSVRQPPVCLAWLPQGGFDAGNPSSKRQILIATARGSIVRWNSLHGEHVTIRRRELTQTDHGAARKWKLENRPTVLRCNMHKSSTLAAIGYKGGRIEVFNFTDGENASTSEIYIDVSSGKMTSKAVIVAKVTDLQWDPLSIDYLLCAFQEADSMFLLDVSKEQVMQRFPLKGRHRNVVGLAWQAWAPGTFLAISENNGGCVSVWNVSQQHPSDLIQVSSGSSVQSMCNWGSFFAFGLESGAISAFDLRRNLDLGSCRPSHRETVFDVRFQSSSGIVDPEIASCSFDGRAMIFGARDLICRKTLKHAEKPVVYSICWSPSPRKWIASCTYSGHVSIWDVSHRHGKLLDSKKLHKAPSYRVSWNKVNHSLLASSSADGFVIVSKVCKQTGTLTIQTKLNHSKKKVFGCEWAPDYSESNPMLACGFGDGSVGVWNVLLKSLVFSSKVHTGKVFHVAWNPFRPGILASGSDDRTILVWRVPNLEPIICLEGHTSNVRALVWSPEIDFLLMSGSWDATIRIWNINRGTCMETVEDHHGDVYGLDIDPGNPFTVVSSSRDTTIRLWTLRRLLPVMQAKAELVSKILFKKEMERNKFSASGFAESLLKGEKGSQLLDQINNATSSNDELDNDMKVDLLQQIYEFFDHQHQNHGFWKWLRGRSKVKNGKIEPDLAKRAIAAGNFRQACEIFRRNGEWEKALAFAPAVSFSFWKEVMREFGQEKQNVYAEDAVSAFLAVGEIQKGVSFFHERKNLSKAISLVQNVVDGCFPSKEVDERIIQRGNKEISSWKEEQFRLISEKVRFHLEKGEVLNAATEFLIIGDTDRAIFVLLMMGEADLALIIACIRENGNPSDDVLLAGAKWFEQIGCAEFAFNLLRMHSSSSSERHLLCARVHFPVSVRERFGLRSTEHCRTRGNEMLSSSRLKKDEQLKALALLASSGDFEAHLTVTRTVIEEICLIFSKDSWDLPRANELGRFMHSIDLNRIFPEPSRVERNKALAICSFLGVLNAISQGLDMVVLPLFRNLRFLIRENELSMQFPVPLSTIIDIESRFMLRFALKIGSSDEQQARAILFKAQQLTENEEGTSKQLHNAIVRAQSEILPEPCRNSAHLLQTAAHFSKGLPNGNTRKGKRSYFTRAIIRGPVTSLEREGNYLSLAEATAWAKVNPFSPLNTGATIFPSFHAMPPATP